jgi:hypothetical protein
MGRYNDTKIIRTINPSNSNPESIPSGKRIYSTTKYPEIPRSNNDLYVYCTAGDRYDTLAVQYYNDSSLWWIISIANASLNQNSLTPPLGVQIRIPINPSPIKLSFNKLNSI